MNYRKSQFSKDLLYFRLTYGHCDICATLYAIVKFMPLVLLMAQVAETHIYKWI